MSKEGVVLDKKGNVISDLEGKAIQDPTQSRSTHRQHRPFESNVRIFRIPPFAILLFIPVIIAIFVFFGTIATIGLIIAGASFKAVRWLQKTLK